MTRAAVVLLALVALAAAVLLLAAPVGNVSAVPTAPPALDPATPMQWACAPSATSPAGPVAATPTPECWPVQP